MTVKLAIWHNRKHDSYRVSTSGRARSAWREYLYTIYTQPFCSWLCPRSAERSRVGRAISVVEQSSSREPQKHLSYYIHAVSHTQRARAESAVCFTTTTAASGTVHERRRHHCLLRRSCPTHVSATIRQILRVVPSIFSIIFKMPNEITIEDVSKKTIDFYARFCYMIVTYTTRSRTKSHGRRL